MNYVESIHPQGSAAWLSERLGKVTGSKVDDIYATVKTGEAAARRNYRLQLALERITGESEPVYVNDAMRRGTELEPFARSAYELHSGNLVSEVGFLSHPEMLAGTSPDGMIWNGTLLLGVFEAKCPGATKHLEYLDGHKVPSEYRKQCLHHLWITGAEWCDFVSFHPKFPEQLRLFCVRLQASEVQAELSEHAQKVAAFLAEIDDTVRQIMQRAA